MAGKGGGAGVSGTIKKIALWFLGLGFLMALLKIFNGDPFGIVNWVWESSLNIINSIGDFLSGNKSFREIFTKPVPKRS